MEFEIKDQKYRVAKLSVFDQLKVSRKLLPVLAGVISDISVLRAAQNGGDMMGALETVLPKIADAIADMPDESVDAILYPCLAAVSRQHMKSWVPVCQQNTLSFDDIDLFVMLQLVARVVADSLGNFLPANPIKETAPPPAA
ncbi:hypothetical protein FVB13_07905 [Escherichia coli]|uniref:phage tail assembly chaperone n=1 Tax=Escherichia coli TaxID=562 RepID=UPI00128DEB16|nr:hypothetical protein [Escherichia coli]MPU29126.1 hypothetical protein [Escherichia coli]MPU39467.1 hypothetical protein [Escherichia coli]